MIRGTIGQIMEPIMIKIREFRGIIIPLYEFRKNHKRPIIFV